MRILIFKILEHTLFRNLYTNSIHSNLVAKIVSMKYFHEVLSAKVRFPEKYRVENVLFRASLQLVVSYEEAGYRSAER